MHLNLSRLRAHRDPDRLARVTGVALLPPTAAPSPELAAFLAHGERCAWSPKTLRAYRLELLRVERITGAPLVAADRADLERYLGWLSKRGVKASTVNKSLVVMKSFTKWALRTDVLTIDPTRSLVQAKEAKILPVHFTPAEARDSGRR
jgi:site-specific recombinase XerD